MEASLASFTGRTCFEIFDMLGVAGAGPLMVVPVPGKQHDIRGLSRSI